MSALVIVAALWSCSGMGPATTQACPFDGGPNPAECPATWSAARMQCSGSAACTHVDSRCWYPGAGDDVGCWATALLGCFDVDGGATGEWRCAQ
jgi:hypothetical protein